jgi:hypothetical protein
MKSSFALAAAAVLVSGSAMAQDHLVSRETAQSRLVTSASERRQALDVLDRALATPEAATAASSLGADLAAVRAAVPALSDAELADLSMRASALDTDPVAGLDSDIKMLLMIFLIVAIVILVLQAVD